MDIQTFPEEVRRLIKDASVAEVTTGKSGDGVFRLTGQEGVRFFKISSMRGYSDLKEEFETLTWLGYQRFAYAPQHPRLFSTPSHDFLMMDAITGTALNTNLHSDPVVVGCATMLRQLHDTPKDDCPHRRDLAGKIHVARQRSKAGRIDVDDFDDERTGWSAQMVLDEILRTMPTSEDVVFTHGDFSPANIIFLGQNPSGLVDWGRAGLADRYQDLALFCRSLSERQRTLFLTAYGIEAPDHQRLRFYALLDELF